MGTYKIFKYHEIMREGVTLGLNEYGNEKFVTPDGYRTFKPEKMSTVTEQKWPLKKVKHYIYKYVKAEYAEQIFNDLLDSIR